MFSVIIPTYNEEKYLPRLLKSIARQKLQPEEVIVADNHSKDKTREVASEFDVTIVDGGTPAGGRNRGAEAASSDILVFFDADVELPRPDFFNKIIGEFIAKDADIASCLATHIPEETTMPDPSHISFNTTKRINRVTTKLFKKIIGELGWCVIITRKLYDKIGGFDESTYTMEDSEFFQRAIDEGGKYYVIPVRIRVSRRRFATENRSLSSTAKVNLLLLALTTATFLGIKGIGNLKKKYEEEKGTLGGGTVR